MKTTLSNNSAFRFRLNFPVPNQNDQKKNKQFTLNLKIKIFGTRAELKIHQLKFTQWKNNYSIFANK
jgi:hypothetical protein